MATRGTSTPSSIQPKCERRHDAQQEHQDAEGDEQQPDDEIIDQEGQAPRRGPHAVVRDGCRRIALPPCHRSLPRSSHLVSRRQPHAGLPKRWESRPPSSRLWAGRRQFVNNTFNYPTLAEAYKIAGLDAWNRMGQEYHDPFSKAAASGAK